MRAHVALHADCPGDVDGEQETCAEEIHWSTSEAWDYQCCGCGDAEAPDGETDVDLGLDDAIGDADEVENVREVVP